MNPIARRCAVFAAAALILVACGDKDPLMAKANAGDPDAMNAVGERYEAGKDPESKDGRPNLKFAVQWYRGAAEKGNARAMFNLGRDAAREAETHRPAALAGVSTGRKYFHDYYKKAAEWYEQSAQKGDVDAQLELAVIYLFGRGLEQDLPKAKSWAEKALAQGNKDAQKVLDIVASGNVPDERSQAADAVKQRQQVIPYRW